MQKKNLAQLRKHWGGGAVLADASLFGFHLTSLFCPAQGPPNCLAQKEGLGGWVSSQPPSAQAA